MYYHRLAIFVLSLYALLLVLVGLHIAKWLVKDNNNNEDRLLICNQTTIQKYYMSHQSPEQLFATNPVRSPFTYELTNSKFCSTANPDMLLFVISKSASFGSRNAIRRTWGNFKYVKLTENYSQFHFKLLFLIDIDETRLKSIKLEQAIYKDIVQVRLPQYYILSSYRDMAMLYWAEKYCPNARLTFKTDDDILLNTFLLANALKHIFNNQTDENKVVDTTPLIYGVLIQNSPAVRLSRRINIETKVYLITDNEYPCKYYPPFMSGFGYFVNRPARSKLVHAFFRHENVFPISDVYITGILAEYMDIKRKTLPFKISVPSAGNCKEFFNEKNSFACASIFHYKSQQESLIGAMDVFEKFNVYWQHVYENRYLYQAKLFF